MEQTELLKRALVLACIRISCLQDKIEELETGYIDEPETEEEAIDYAIYRKSMAKRRAKRYIDEAQHGHIDTIGI